MLAWRGPRVGARALVRMRILRVLACVLRGVAHQSRRISRGTACRASASTRGTAHLLD